LDFLHKAMPIWERLGSPDGLADTYHLLAVLHERQGDPRKANEYYQKADETRKRIKPIPSPAPTFFQKVWQVFERLFRS